LRGFTVRLRGACSARGIKINKKFKKKNAMLRSSRLHVTGSDRPLVRDNPSKQALAEEGPAPAPAVPSVQGSSPRIIFNLLGGDCRNQAGERPTGLGHGGAALCSKRAKACILAPSARFSVFHARAEATVAKLLSASPEPY